MAYFKNINLIKVIKIAVGTGLAIFIAGIFGLNYSASAGIITLLSIQDTKKSTIKIAVKRIAAFVLAMLISLAVFTLFGYDIWALVCYLLIFVAVCMFFDLNEGLSPCTVLVTHIMAEKYMSFDIVKNEAALMLIGTSVGIFLNMYMPRNLKHIREYQVKIENEIKYMLDTLVGFLSDENDRVKLEYDFDSLDKLIDSAISKSYIDKDNILSYDLKYFINYMEMRKSQIMTLRYIFEQGKGMKTRPSQARDLAELIFNLVPKLHESYNAVNALMDLYFVKEKMKNSELPKSREEFEDRAILHSMVVNFEQFLEIKREFAANLSEEEKNIFWNR